MKKEERNIFRNIILLLGLLFCLGLCACDREEEPKEPYKGHFTEYLSEKKAGKEKCVIWSGQKITDNADLWEKFLSETRAGKDAQMKLASQYEPEEDIYIIKRLRMENGIYIMEVQQDGNTLEYQFPHLLEIPGDNCSYWILTEAEEMTYRELYRNLWVEPEVRETAFRLWMVTGEGEAGTLTTDLENFPEQDLEEILLLDSLDSLPVYRYDYSRYSEKTAKEDQGLFISDRDIILEGEERWKEFLGQCEAGKSCRIRIVRPMDTLWTIDLFFDGEYYDVILNGDSLAHYNYRYLFESSYMGGANRVTLTVDEQWDDKKLDQYYYTMQEEDPWSVFFRLFSYKY